MTNEPKKSVIQVTPAHPECQCQLLGKEAESAELERAAEGKTANRGKWMADGSKREEVVRSTSKDWFDVRAPGWLATGPCFAPCLLVGIALGSAKISKSNFFAMAVGVTVVSTSAHRPCDHKATRCPASQGQRSPFDEHPQVIKT